MSDSGNLHITFGPLHVIHELEPQDGGQFLTVTLASRFKITLEGSHVMYNLPVGMQVQMQVAYVDSGGNAAAVDGDVTWESSDPAIATATVDAADSTIVTVTPVGPAGQVQVTATADADLGSGVRELITIADITVVAGEAVAGTISPVGAATPIP